MANAAAIDSQVLQRALIDQPRLTEDIRIIGTIGPSPMPPVVASRKLSKHLKQDLRGIFQTLHQLPQVTGVLKSGLIHSFIPVTNSHYDPIREVLNARANTLSV